ncbi:hypothetical protein AALB81_19330 [Lachnospiraceae bacterium 48-33]
MSDNYEFIILAGNPVKKFPSRLQELYLSTPGFLPCWQKSIRKDIFRVHGTGNISFCPGGCIVAGETTIMDLNR